MKPVRAAVVLALGVALVSAVALQADVKTQEKSQTRFEGVLGRMMGLFGGKAAREGVVSTIAVKGSRKARVSDTGGEIIDLSEEKVYTLDMRKKSYTVQTFAEIRREMEEQMRKAKEELRKSEGRKDAGDQPQMEVSVSAKVTGQRKAINGFDCRQVITTITVHEKGKTIEQNGGLVMTADTWLAPKNPALKEIADFDMKYWKALQTPAMADAAAQMAQALAMYPGLGQAFTKLQSEKGNLDGTAILTTVTVESAPNPQQAAQAGEQESGKPAGIGGMLGGLGRLGRKKTDEPAAPASGGSGVKGRTAVMTTINEVLSVAAAASEADVAVPPGFKLT
ncbi:MAG: hypothetical protein IMZ55_13700 [Acidobacteria bacterium]|nr:hypothetical protein [Acidobacteriota bacterium]